MTLSAEIIPERKKSPRLLPEGFDMRLAEVGDIPAIMPLAHEFFDATQFKHFGVEFSDANGEKYLSMILENNLTPLILALVDGAVVGWIMYSYDLSFFKRPIAVLNTIFVTKKYKRTLIGRMLISAAMEMAKEDQSCAFFSPVNSGTENISSLGNMFSKAGFKMSGYIMSRSL